MSDVTPKSYPLRGANNQLLTASLFFEPWQATNERLRAEGFTPVFTLINDREGYVNARKAFLAERDPTGVLWAEKWLDGVNHLNRLMGAEWFREAFEVWVQETEQLIQAEALDKINQIAKSSSPAAFQAAKYLAGKEWKKQGRGRPSKDAISRELKKEVEKLSQEDADLARITQLRVVNA